MTRLTKPVRRRVQLARGEFVITLEPGGWISFRRVGSRTAYSCTLDTVLVRAADAHQQRAKEERRAARGEKPRRRYKYGIDLGARP